MKVPPVFRATALFAAALVSSVVAARAATAKIWTSDSTADFSAGEARGIAVTVNGELVLSRALERVEGVGEAVLYDAVTARDGVVFVGTGQAGRVLRVSLQASALEIALATQPASDPWQLVLSFAAINCEASA